MSSDFRSLLGIAFFFAATIARADGLFCQSYGPGGVNFGIAIAAGTYQCAGAGAGTGNGAPVVTALDQAGPGTVQAAQTSAGGGVFAAFAAANATAAPGLLRAYASADSFAMPPSDGISFAQAIGRADSSFYDFGQLVAIPGAAPGDPVAVRLTIDVTGTFLNLGEGTEQVWVARNNSTLVLNRITTVLGLHPADFAQIDLPGFHVGDQIGFYMRLTAEAGATNAGSQLSSRSQIADLGNTGHLYLDVLSANARFVSTSGHDYGFDVALPSVPEPETYAMLLAGLGLLGFVARRRTQQAA